MGRISLIMSGKAGMRRLRNLLDSIITTKLHIPRSRSPLVVRSRLFDKLAEGLSGRLTLIIAPAGYGKTTLLSEWSARANIPVAWVSLDCGDQDRMRFWTHTVAACALANPRFNQHRVVSFSLTDTATDSLVAALINELNHLQTQTVLVWDDFHLIEEPTVLRDVEYFLDRLPPHIHLYIATRAVPPIALARLRARGELSELDADDLRFTAAETVALFGEVQKLPLSSEEIADILEQTEGWISGMRLSALSISKKAKERPTVTNVSGCNREIADYFLEEVFSRLPDHLQQFLRKTSILEWMNASLCEAVTGMKNCASYLHEMEKMNLFLVPLDDQREWYRYHHLFQQFLYGQLSARQPGEWAACHLAAARWLETNGYGEEAVEHYLACAHYERAVPLIEALAPSLMNGKWITLYTWLNRIPRDLLFKKPFLLLTHVAALYLSGRVVEATDLYRQLDQQLKAGAAGVNSGELQVYQAGMAFMVAFRAFLERDFETFLDYSKRFLRIQPDGDFFIGFGNAADGYHRALSIYLTSQGLKQAETLLPRIWSLWSNTKNSYFIAHLCIEYGRLHYERNRLNQAKSFLRKAMRLARAVENPYLIVVSTIGMAEVLWAQGYGERADSMLVSLGEQIPAGKFPFLVGKIDCFRVKLAKRQKDTAQVAEWLKRSGLRYDDEIPLRVMDQYELLACLLAGQGKTRDALELTERLLFMAKEEGWKSEQIRLLVQKSLILSQMNYRAQSMDTLEQALALAEPDQYIRTFVDEGPPLLKLLNQYLALRTNRRRKQAGRVSLAYVKLLIGLLTDQTKETERIELALAKLTANERKILNLIAAGLSNQAIAAQMGVARSTVKTHINNIYRKLKVANRQMIIHWANSCRTHDLSDQPFADWDESSPP